MIARLSVVCVVELVVVVLLAWSVFATPVAEATPRVTPAPEFVPPQAATPPEPGEAAPAPSSPSAASTRVQRQPVAAKWNPEDPVGVLLTGTVRWSDGTPLADPNVSAKLDKRYAPSDGGADGAYALAGLSPGEWTVSVRAEGAVDVTEQVLVGDDAVQQHDFVIARSFPVKVLIVTPEGEDGTRALRLSGLSFGDFSVVGQKDRFPERLAPTDYGRVFVGDAKWDGEMNPKDGFAGTLRFATAPPAHVALLQRHLVIEQQLVQPKQSEVKFVVDLAALKALAGSATARVLDADTSQPIEGANVSLSTSNRMGGGSKTDAEGRVLVEGLSPGLLRCQISVKEHEQMYTTVRVEPGQRLDLGEVRLGAALPLTGRVVDETGVPVGGAQLRWAELKWLGQARPFATNRGAHTEADGSFQLWGTGTGLIAVTAVTAVTGDGLQARGVFDNPPPAPIELRLCKPAECVVTRPRDPTRSFTVMLFDAQRQPLTAMALEDRKPQQTLSMPPGDYTFEVRDEREQIVQTGTLHFGAIPTALEIR